MNKKTANYGKKDLELRGALYDGFYGYDKIKSIMVPFGYVVDLYEDDSLQGVHRQ